MEIESRPKRKQSLMRDILKLITCWHFLPLELVCLSNTLSLIFMCKAQLSVPSTFNQVSIDAPFLVLVFESNQPSLTCGDLSISPKHECVVTPAPAEVPKQE